MLKTNDIVSTVSLLFLNKADLLHVIYVNRTVPIPRSKLNISNLRVYKRTIAGMSSTVRRSKRTAQYVLYRYFYLLQLICHSVTNSDCTKMYRKNIKSYCKTYGPDTDILGPTCMPRFYIGVPYNTCSCAIADLVGQVSEQRNKDRRGTQLLYWILRQ